MSRFRLESKTHEGQVNFASDKRGGLVSRVCCDFSSKWKGKARTVLRGDLHRLRSPGIRLVGNMFKLVEIPLEKQKLKQEDAVFYHTAK